MQFTDEDILTIIETYSPGESLYHLTRLIQETEEELDPDYGWENALGDALGVEDPGQVPLAGEIGRTFLLMAEKYSFCRGVQRTIAWVNAHLKE